MALRNPKTKNYLFKKNFNKSQNKDRVLLRLQETKYTMYSILNNQHTMFTTNKTQYSILDTKYWILNTQYSLNTQYALNTQYIFRTTWKSRDLVISTCSLYHVTSGVGSPVMTVSKTTLCPSSVSTEVTGCTNRGGSPLDSTGSWAVGTVSVVVGTT